MEKPHESKNPFTGDKWLTESSINCVWGERSPFAWNSIQKCVKQMCSFAEIQRKLNTLHSVFSYGVCAHYWGCFWLQVIDLEREVIISQNKKSGVRTVTGNSVAQQPPRIQTFSLCPLWDLQGLSAHKLAAESWELCLDKVILRGENYFFMYIVLLARKIFSRTS